MRDIVSNYIKEHPQVRGTFILLLVLINIFYYVLPKLIFNTSSELRHNIGVLKLLNSMPDHRYFVISSFKFLFQVAYIQPSGVSSIILTQQSELVLGVFGDEFASGQEIFFDLS